MNRAIGILGMFLVISGFCCCLLASHGYGHSSYTEPYIKIIASQLDSQSKAGETQHDRSWAQALHNQLVSTLETYAGKVQSEKTPLIVLAASAQVIGAMLLFLSGKHRK